MYRDIQMPPSISSSVWDSLRLAPIIVYYYCCLFVIFFLSWPKVATTLAECQITNSAKKEVGKEDREEEEEEEEEEEDDEEDSDEEWPGCNEDASGPKEEQWDCESILSTHSNLYNHPMLISEPGVAKRKVQTFQWSPLLCIMTFSVNIGYSGLCLPSARYFYTAKLHCREFKLCLPC